MNRSINFFISIFFIFLISFFLIRLAPGDPVLLMLGDRGNDPTQYRMMMESLGLNHPLYEQFKIYILNIFTGNFGHSIVSGKSILVELLPRWKASFELGLIVFIFSFFIGSILGIYLAYKFNSKVERILSGSMLVVYCIPIFWLGLLLINIFSLQFNLFPVSGRIGYEFDLIPYTGFYLIDSLTGDNYKNYSFTAFFSCLNHMVLPIITMSIVPIVSIAKITKVSILEVLRKDYILTAKSLGMSESSIFFKHVLRNILVPVLTISSLYLINVTVAGAILTETIFSWPGIGRFLVTSVLSRDYPVIQIVILFIGVFILFVNLILEMLVKIIDPKQRMKV